MNPKAEHPSYLELDCVGPGRASPATHEHVRGCSECGAYVARLEQPEPVPAWARALKQPAPPVKQRRSWWWLASPLVATGALAGAMLWWVPTTEVTDPSVPYVGVKGSPAVTVFIKRGDQVSTWDGASPVTPGDSLRLRVTSAGYRHVWVGARSPRAGWSRLYDGPLAEGETLLPPSWRVDASGEAEELVILVSRDVPDEVVLERALSTPPQDAEAWVVPLQLPKTPGP